MVVGADFPDEQYADFDEWAAAMASDDTDAPTSPLWHGGGQWLLYGLGLVLRGKIVITSMYKTTDLTLTLTLLLSLTVALTPTLTLNPIPNPCSYTSSYPCPYPYPNPYQVSRPGGGHGLRRRRDP